MDPFVVLLSGSRTWLDAARARAELVALIQDCGVDARRPRVLVHGAARGADRLAAAEALALGGWRTLAMPVTPEQWRTQGRAAGVLRNGQMLEVARPDAVLVLRADGESPGTDDMVRRARAWPNAHCVLVRVVRSSGVQSFWRPRPGASAEHAARKASTPKSSSSSSSTPKSSSSLRKTAPGAPARAPRSASDLELEPAPKRAARCLDLGSSNNDNDNNDTE